MKSSLFVLWLPYVGYLVFASQLSIRLSKLRSATRRFTSSIDISFILIQEWISIFVPQFSHIVITSDLMNCNLPFSFVFTLSAWTSLCIDRWIYNAFWGLFVFLITEIISYTNFKCLQFISLFWRQLSFAKVAPL